MVRKFPRELIVRRKNAAASCIIQWPYPPVWVSFFQRVVILTWKVPASLNTAFLLLSTRHNSHTWPKSHGRASNASNNVNNLVVSLHWWFHVKIIYLSSSGKVMEWDLNKKWKIKQTKELIEAKPVGVMSCISLYFRLTE